MEPSETSNVNLIEINKVKVLPNRGRKEFKNIRELAENIKRHGLLHPIVLDNCNLIAGERRLRACTMLPIMWSETDEKSTPANHPVRSIVNGFVPFTTRNNLAADLLKEIELDENLHRENLDWPEQLELRTQAHDLKVKLYGNKTSHNPDGWTLAKTAESFGEDTGAVSRKITFAKQLKEAKKTDPGVIERLRALPLSAAIKEFSRMEVAAKAEKNFAEGKIQLNSNLLEGDCIDLLKTLPENSIDLLLTDPPFGIPELTASTGVGRGNSNSYTASLSSDDNMDTDSVVILIHKLCPELFRVMKPSAHFWIFFAWEIYEELKESMQKAGFEVCPVPAIWDKGRATSPGRSYEPAPCYEPILFGHKPPREKKLNDNCRMVFTQPIIPSVKKIHRFEKPQELLHTIIKLSSNTGDTILDPFAGSGSTCFAAKELSRGCISFEKNKQSFLKAQARLQGVV